MSPASTTLAPMVDRLTRPDWVRRINLMAGSVGGDARDLVPIDAADLLVQASTALGGMPSGDLGDPRWQERFEMLVAALDNTPMHVLGRLMTKQELLRSLRARLLVTAAIDAAPVITAAPVAAPVIITGPARSGTSILFELLALDPGLRAPTAAEALHPMTGAPAVVHPVSPPAGEALHPVPSTAGVPEPLVLSECEQEFWADIQPEFRALHELRSDLPVECVTLTQGSFCGFHWSMVAPLKGWMPDPAVNYAYERQLLQVLQHTSGPAQGSGAGHHGVPAHGSGAGHHGVPAHGGGAGHHGVPAHGGGAGHGAGSTQWVLKTPAHLMLLPLLFNTFNDAWVVQTHRDPAKTIPSTVSTSTMIQWLRSDDVDVDSSAQSVLATFAAGLNGSVQLRQSGAVPAERFVDVHFTELMTDPVATLRAAYERMGRDFTDAHAEAVLDYLAHKPKGKFGVHRYQPEDWGFTAEGLRAAMAPYIQHFNVTREG